ncbi:hydrogenase expression/formation protein HypE [Congregibacter variabilis]|uniref:Hydrogenase expression/formation protein HypE n=1 Tax=Congregibacter variabilis TaxID=3081200 RepID=A0ABZ0I2S9_9GAMM|nr:hydrogenase expression/formation protein HypE [Congregibacter sp. IMCC43200]
MSECAFPFAKYPLVTLAHGAGGRFTQQLIRDVFSAAMPDIRAEHDGADLLFPQESAPELVFTTDSYVVSPLRFPGGDIGQLAVTGTCNDLAVCGAQPAYLSCGWIIEEGFSTESLYSIAQSMGNAAQELGVQIVTGDTKVVERGHGDGVYLNVSGIGIRRTASHPELIQPGDLVVVSGDLGRHGTCILTQREDLRLQAPIESDCMQLWPQIERLLPLGDALHCMRDLTRGGLATALAELSETAALQIDVFRDRVPVSSPVASVCELFGLDALYVANEGRMVIFVDPASENQLLEALGPEAKTIGSVGPGEGVIAHSDLGGSQILDLLSGEQLPRIC